MTGRQWITDEYLMDNDSFELEGLVITDGRQPEGPRDGIVHLEYRSIAVSPEARYLFDL